MEKRRILGWAVFTLASLLTGCASLPAPQGRTETTALTDTPTRDLAARSTPGVTANPGKTGIHAVPNPQDAFAARVLLAGAAEKSIDAQYFLWHGDQVGNLLFEALWRAAGRGVRVRLLIDDINTAGLDDNPGGARRASGHRGAPVQPVRPAQRPGPQLPRRLHAPEPSHAQQVVHRGQPGEHRGRTQYRQRILRRRLRPWLRRSGRVRRGTGGAGGFKGSSISTGTVRRPTRRQAFVGTPGPEAAAALEARFAANARRPGVAVAYIDAVRAAPLVQQLLDRQLALEWTRAQLVYDDPGKTLDTTQRTDRAAVPGAGAHDRASPSKLWTWSRLTSCRAPRAPPPWRRWPAAA